MAFSEEFNKSSSNSTTILSAQYIKKGLKIPKGESEYVYRRRAEKTMAKRKTTIDKQRSTKHYTYQPVIQNI